MQMSIFVMYSVRSGQVWTQLFFIAEFFSSDFKKA